MPAACPGVGIFAGLARTVGLKRDAGCPMINEAARQYSE